MNRLSQEFPYFFFLLTLLLAALLFLQLENSGLMRCACCYRACVLLLSALGNSTLARAFLTGPPELLSFVADIGVIARSFLFLSLTAWPILAPYQPSKGYRRCLFGFLSLAATGNDGCVQIAIANRVAEGTEPDKAQLFSRYYRNPATSDIPGSGIGLRIAGAAAGKIGATLTYQAEAGIVSFQLRVPC